MRFGKFLTVSAAAAIAVSVPLNVYATPPYICSYAEFHFIDDGYDVEGQIDNYLCNCGHALKIQILSSGNVVISGEVSPFEKYYGERCFKIPDRFMEGKDGISYVTGTSGSFSCTEFDINPENEYMKLDESKRIIFSKDGKKLMSAAVWYNDSKYKIPAGTEIIGRSAFSCCDSIKEIIMPESIEEIEKFAFGIMDSLEKVNIPAAVEEIPEDCFACCYNLKEVYIPENSKLKKISMDSFSPANGTLEITIPSFEVEMNERAFDVWYENVKIKSYVKPTVEGEYKNGICKLTWNEIPNAKSYEVYQKRKDGTYKLLKTVEDTSVELKGAKKGYRYTFAVKAIGEIETKPVYQEHDDHYPEFFAVEGAMSDNVTVSAK